MPGSTGSASNTPRKSGKKSRRPKSRTKAEREVLVHGCLPPQVDGQIRCFVVVSLKKVTWKTSKYPTDVFLRCLWWGDTLESAAIFSPAENKVVARYPVRSGPKQMAAYLTDAGTLHVDVLRGVDMSVIGKVQIYGLSALAAGKSLSGPYPIFSSKSEIIGHINVSVSMQAMHTFEDSGSSILPTTDLDNTEQSEKVVGQERIDTRLGTPSAYSSILSHQQVVKTPDVPAADQQEAEICSSSQVADDDLICNLLAKGQRLRSAMITSTVDSVPADSNVLLEAMRKSTDPELLDNGALTSQLVYQTKSVERRHPELNTVDLVLGSPQKKAVYISDTDSASSLAAGFEMSDFEDPAHDQEILDLLFYKSSRKSHQQSMQDAGTLTELPSSTPQQKHAENEPVTPKQAQTGRMKEPRPSLEDIGNVRPPSRSGSVSPRISLSLPPSPSGNQSDSGTSRVSFDMTASDDEDTRSAAEGLSVEQLTLLARVSVARVQIDKLHLKQRPNTPVEKKAYKGRPPPAKTTKYGTYFVEYQFPVVAASRDQNERNTTATETVRAVSKKVEKSGAVTWNHHTVFPVYFDGQTIEKWWNSMLVLKIHHRAQTSRTAALIGSCSIQMKQLLQSLTFGLDLEIPVTKFHKHNSGRSKRRRRRADVIGTMKVNIQLDSDSPSFATALRELQIAKARKQHPLLRPKPDTPIAAPSKPDYVRSEQPVKVDLQSQQPSQQQQQPTELMLHVLLHVSEGRQLRTSHQSQPIVAGGAISSYVVCRIFWSTDRLRSEVCWSCHTPDYMINETMPLHVTKEVLANMANNYMVLEVWEKRSSSQKDQLLGYAKLPLNTFYMSYKEPKIAQVLIKSQYPVIAVDSYMPVVNPLTGKNMGEVKVLLAMGTQQQVMSLQTLKVISAVTQLEQRQQSEQAAAAQPIRSVAERDSDVIVADKNEHRFDIKVVAVRDLTLDEGMYMGEADCFVQYHFPAQYSTSFELALKAFRSPTTLCTDSVTFDDRHSHLIKLPKDTNLQSALISAFGRLHGSAVPFELWCRFYHPNTRDQLMARCLLPLAKVLALVTMANDSDPINSQSYSLPLLPASDSDKVGTVGVMDIYIQHTKKVSRQQSTSSAPSLGVHALGHVTLSACIESVAGLKSAALALSHRHQCLDYYSSVGVNLYVKVMVSFQPRSEVKVSKTEPRVFYLEEFGFKSLFDLPLMIDSSTSLAHCLHTGYLVVEIWHQSLKDSLLDDCPGIPPSTDILLGVSSVPLTSLLSHKTGIKGWYPLNCPPELYTTTQSHDPMMGSIKVQLRLTGSQDISNIIDSASKVGYQVPNPGVDATDTAVDEMTEVKIEVDWFTLPDWMILKSKEENLSINSGCYIKASFYSNDIAYSSALRLSDKGDNFECKCDVRLKYMQSASTSFLWYLFDQHLELELWLTDRLEAARDEVTPSSRDRYLGTAYISLGELGRRRQCTVSDVYPIYKPNTDRMGRALMQVHISRRPHLEPQIHHMKVCRKERTDEVPTTQLDDLDSSDQSEGDSLDEDTIEAMISVEEANRLTIGQSPGSTLHVSYSLAEREHITPGVPSSNKPNWMYEKCVRLHLPSIQKAKHLVLKLWCKSEDKGSQVLGFTTIDLRPLLAGMSHLSGWYNIVDFTGLCQGQIKCGIQPLTQVEKRDASTPPQVTVQKSIPSKPVCSDRFITASGYSEFPSHISRFSEQRVHLSLSAQQPSTSAELLRKQLSELDVMTNNLRRKLYKPSLAPLEPTAISHVTQSAAPYRHLISTVNQVHSNVLELVEQGVVTSDQIAPSHLSTSQAHGSKATDVITVTRASHRTGSTSSDGSASAHKSLEQPRASDSPSSFTPRTQATYSMASDDEQFSPPIFTRHRNEKFVDSKEESTQSSDWASDGVRPLSGSDVDSLDGSLPTCGLQKMALGPDTCTSSQLAGNSRKHLHISGDGKGGQVLGLPPAPSHTLMYAEPTESSHGGAQGNKCDGASHPALPVGSPLPDGVRVNEMNFPHRDSVNTTSAAQQDVMSPRNRQVRSDDEETGPQKELSPQEYGEEWSAEESDYEEEEAVSRTINEELPTLDDVADQALGALHDSSLGFAGTSTGTSTSTVSIAKEPRQSLSSLYIAERGRRSSDLSQDSSHAVYPKHSSNKTLEAELPDELHMMNSDSGSFDGYDDRRAPADDMDRPPVDDMDRPPVDDMDRPPADDMDRPPVDDMDRPPVDDMDRPPVDDMDRPPVDDMDRPPVDDMDRPPVDDMDRLPADDMDRLPADDMNRPPANDMNRPPADDMNSLAFSRGAVPVESFTKPVHSVTSLPSFFPSKEELAAKLNAAKFESHSKDRFTRKPISRIVREQFDTTDRARRVADIFASRFNKHTS